MDLDSDWNEQVEIWDERFRCLVRAAFGDFAVPLASNEIARNNSQALKIDHFLRGPGGVIDFSIGRGIVYAGGYRFKLDKDITFRTQLDYPEPEIEGQGEAILVYFEVWEKTISYVDDENLREPALGGPDTCLRMKTIGQVKAIMTNLVENPERAENFVAGLESSERLLFTL